MADRTFTKVSHAVWTSRRFRGVGNQARLYYLYLLTNTHIDSTGCYRLPDAYACADCGIDADAHKAATAELIAADMIAVDAEYVLIKRWFKHNPPMNCDHAEGTRRRIANIESDLLREECEATFTEAETALNERLERISALKAERSAKAELKLVHTRAGKGFGQILGSDLTQTRYMNGGGK